MISIDQIRAFIASNVAQLAASHLSNTKWDKPFYLTVRTRKTGTVTAGSQWNTTTWTGAEMQPQPMILSITSEMQNSGNEAMQRGDIVLLIWQETLDDAGITGDQLNEPEIQVGYGNPTADGDVLVVEDADIYPAAAQLGGGNPLIWQVVVSGVRKAKEE
jgi:hypothetical protein